MWWMLLIKVCLIALMCAAGFFVITFTIYFFNLDMKLMASLTKPLTAWYDWSKKRRDAKKHNA